MPRKDSDRTVRVPEENRWPWGPLAGGPSAADHATDGCIEHPQILESRVRYSRHYVMAFIDSFLILYKLVGQAVFLLSLLKFKIKNLLRPTNSLLVLA
jgi:hypothetical protein